jgi:hypothetical protein
MQDYEKVLQKFICQEFAKHECAPFIAGIPGVGAVLGARIVSLIPMNNQLDFCTYSKLKKFAGFCPGFDKLVKKQKAPFCTKLRSALHTVWITWLKLDAAKMLPENHYMKIYKNWVNVYSERNKDWNSWHIKLAARRKCLNIFLSHLWEYWRKAKGWEARKHYVHEYLGHQDVYDLYEFWDEKLSNEKLKKWRAGTM